MKEEKIDYQKQLSQIISQVEGLPKKPSLLLHACCAPCSSYVMEYLAKYFDITIFYFNPNIHPQKEYERRLEELKVFLTKFPVALQNSVKLVVAEYDPELYFIAVNTREETELQTEAERGERCRRCYDFRMKKAYDYAVLNKFDYFTTTLSISPYKDAKKINTIGYTFDKLSNVKYLPADFKKKNGFLRSLQLSAEFGLYRQDYCGCVYSMRTQH
ncbi:epoxyqueuosine reductase QueH [Treponema sp.]|uniref:epoxyqueuosine reductase QueH n=1 Tax=Treponema sp. TaxID=166 RepID=UPI0025CBD1B1|nr:epoxyqueuosine reductase QueH [Treponema sp.]MCR5219252.1 epoxyqueuosine reductase QueH [Treponema sp.]